VNSKLSLEDRERRDRSIVAMYKAGQSAKEIAAVYEITAGRVVQILNAAGVQMR
jgi:DNA-directed RNA polymerase specialized sigma subunit